MSYSHRLALHKGKHFIGESTITFYVQEQPGEDDLFLDFMGIAIADLRINGKPAEVNFRDQKIFLSKD